MEWMGFLFRGFDDLFWFERWHRFADYRFVFHDAETPHGSGCCLTLVPNYYSCSSACAGTSSPASSSAGTP